MTVLSKPRGASRLILAGTAGLASLVVVGAFLATADQPHGGADHVATETKPKHTNGLINATSPYLLQHAHNPVDWQEWGPAALERARKEDKPIFLSIGYSACHWCHVMAHESFENEQTAAILNEHFVCIKVDREERPDIDEIYMQATVVTTGSGGWPMSVFTTSDGSPFFCGTYFPRPQFEQLLHSVAEAWRDNRPALLERGSSITAHLQEWANEPVAGEDQIPEQAVVDTANTLLGYFDTQHGGLRSDANKFPPSMAMELMLRAYLRTGDAKLLQAVETTLTKMGRGGIYDHIGGGICRYSTDPRWLVPHFEKMLYDQALVAGIYLDAYQLTKNPFHAEIARGILDYVIADLQSAEGGIYSTRDADSEGMEGKYYIWTVEQVEAVLGAEDAKLFNAYYDVTAKGNWFEAHGHAPAGPKNILNIQHDLKTVAKRNDMDPAVLDSRLGVMRGKMLTARRGRVAPGLDDKILTGWNGLMIASLAKGAVVLDEPKYAKAAARSADFVLRRLRSDGKLLRTYRAGKAHLTAYLSDYAFLTEGLINLYEATFDPRWLKESVALTDDLIKRYHDEAGGGFFYTAIDAERLVTRTKDANDGAVPSGNSVQALNLLRLALLTGKPDYRTKAESIFRAFATLAASSPGRFDRLLCAVDFYHGRPKEIAIIAPSDSPEGRAMWRAVHGTYRPNKVVAGLDDGDAASAASIVDIVPLLANKRRIDGKVTAFVCRNYKCKRPVTNVGKLVELLDAGD